MDTIPFNKFRINAELDQILNKEYRKERFKHKFFGPLNLLLETAENLKAGLSTELVSIEESGKTTILNIAEITVVFELPEHRTEINLIFFNIKNTVIAVLPELFFEFISKIKARLGNEDPSKYEFGLGLKKHFLDIVSEVPYTYISKGKAIQDIQEINTVLRDYFYVNLKKQNMYYKEMQGGF